MIRINLLAVEREAKKKTATFQAGQKVTLACGLILVLTAGVVGWLYWQISRKSSEMDQQIASAQAESSRLHGIIQQVQNFEQQKAQLQQRVVLIEQLRKSQTGPVHMLDQVSKSLPPMLWLTLLKQDPKDGSLSIVGRSTSQTGVSDFVNNLEGSGYFKKSIEIVSTETVAQAGPTSPEVVTFSLKAEFTGPGEAPPLPAAPAAAASGRGGIPVGPQGNGPGRK
jgi:type IV pilus assembly protein PilN